MMKQLTLTISILLITLISFSQSQSKSALFLGNSYTYANNLPQLLADIAFSMGDSLYYESNTPGGYTLEGHSTNAASISKINSKNWDYVILQDQSQRPSFSPSQVQLEVYPYADSLNRIIKDNDSCTTTMFFMTWGRKNGDQTNCPFYPPVCTYNGMQQRLRESYLEIGQMLNAEVAPVGATWKQIRKDFPDIDLYSSDESHPSIAGSYLTACVFYSSIFHKSPVGASFPSGISSSYAATIQLYTKLVVLDSLDKWFIDTTTVRASFTTNQIDDTSFSFTNNSINAASYFWDFGDGNYSTLEDPSHIYSTNGTYFVSLIANKVCKSDTILDSVIVNTPAGISNDINNDFILYPNPASDIITIKTSIFKHLNKLEYDILNKSGQLLINGEVSSEKPEIDLRRLKSDVYFLRIYYNDEVEVLKLMVF